VSFQLSDKPLFVHCCHCSWCQRETGSAFVLNALIETQKLALRSGQLETTVIPSASGQGQTLCQCPDCRVVLWSHYGAAGDAIAFVRVGTLEDPTSCPPDIHIFVSAKQPWLLLDTAIPVVEEYYRFKDLWPKESLARLKAQMKIHD